MTTQNPEAALAALAEVLTYINRTRIIDVPRRIAYHKKNGMHDELGASLARWYGIAGLPLPTAHSHRSAR